MQPTGQDNDNTEGHTQTGTGAPNYSGAYTPTTTSTAASQTTSSSNKIRLM